MVWFGSACAYLPDAVQVKLQGLTERFSVQALGPIGQVPVTFASPELLVVRSGDTLAKLAARHDVSVEDLRGWNGLETDLIEVDQTLLIWKIAKVAVATAKAPPSLSGVMRPGSAGAVGFEPTATPAASAGNSPIPTEIPLLTAGSGNAVAVAEPPKQRIAIERPMLAGLFGLSVGSDTDLNEAAKGLVRRDNNLGNDTDLSGRALGTGGGAEALSVKEREMRQVGPKIPDTPVSLPRLTKTPPKRCMSGTTTIDEGGRVSGSGLSVPQINAGMAQISRSTVRCFPSGTEGSYQVIFEIVVGCNGQVSNVFLINGGVVPDRVTSCITHTLGFASFAAHGMPDGVTFQYPMKFSF